MNDELDGTIWASPMLVKDELFKPFKTDLLEAESKDLRETIIQNRRGVPMPAERFPKMNFWNKPNKRRPMPGHVMRNDFIIMSSKCADVLRGFDLGKTSLYPTQIMEIDRVTPVPGSYFCIGFGETKESIIIDKSDVRFWAEKYWASHFRDDGFKVRASAREGVDLWIDSQVRQPVLLSGRLVGALRKARLDKLFHLKKCVVLEA